MYRRRTVEALTRQHAREREQLLQMVADQNDRIMHLAGRPWTPAPADMPAFEPPADDAPALVYDADQLIETEV